MHDNTDNQLTLPLFSDSSLRRGSEYQQNNLQVPSRSQNLKKLSSFQEHDVSHSPQAGKDDDLQARNRFSKIIVVEENGSRQVPVEEPLLKMSTHCNILGSRIKCFCRLLSLLLIMVTLAIMISFRHYLNAKTDANFRSVTADFSFVGSNLAAHPILDIQLLQDGNQTSCPQDYQDLVLAVWPGAAPRCADQGGSTVRRWQQLGKSDCQNYSPRGPINISYWHDSKWCILRAKPESQYAKSSECGAGFRKCSLGLCVLETLDCPLTNLQLNDGSIAKERTKGELPIIGVDVTFNDVPYKFLRQNENGYLKSNLNEKYRFALDTQMQDKLFDQNDFPKEVLSLPGYADVYRKVDSTLSFRKRMSLVEKDICLNIDPEKLAKSSDTIYHLKKTMEGFPIITEVSHWVQIGLIVLTILILRPLHTSWGYLLKGEVSALWMIWAFGLGITEIVVLGVVFDEITSHKEEMVKTQEYLNKLVEVGCFADQEAQDAAIGYGTVMDEETETPLKYSLLSLLITSFSLILLLCSLYDVAKKGARAYRERELWENTNSKGRSFYFGGVKPK